MALTIRRSIEVPFNVPAQLVLGGGLDNGSRWLPHFAPDSWRASTEVVAAGSTAIAITNPGGSVGIRLYRVFVNLVSAAATPVLDGPLYLRFVTGAQIITGWWFDGQPRDHVLDFSPFGLIPSADLTSSLEWFNSGATICQFAWLMQWGREPVAIQNE